MKILFYGLMYCAVVYAQAEYVPVGHKIYSFLDRMDARGIIGGYNVFEIPKTRGEMLMMLKKAEQRRAALAQDDNSILDDLLREFDPALIRKQSKVAIGEGDYNPCSQDVKYFYSYYGKKNGNLFVNLTGELGTINSGADATKGPAQFGILGGEIRGTLLGHAGFFLKGANGIVFGERNTALQLTRFKENWKLNSTPSETFFDETSGYGTLDYSTIRVKLGRDHFLAGYGSRPLLFGGAAPQFDQFTLRLTLGDFTYTSMHAKLLGAKKIVPDPVTGGSAVVDEKFIGYHRLSFTPSKHLTIGAGEMIVYAQRSLDMAYLNPFAFYKTVEHGNQDRDNSMLFFDAANTSFPGLRLYTVLLLDDIDYSKLGSGWFGNQFAWNAGAQIYMLNRFLPLDISFEYFRVEPYVFTHRLPSRNYTTDNSRIGLDVAPNTGMAAVNLTYRFSSRISLHVSFEYALHGANPVDVLSGQIINVGGDTYLGHRQQDATAVKFLDGDREYLRRIFAVVSWEPFTGYYCTASLSRENNSLQFGRTQNTVIGELNMRFLF